MTPNAPHDIWRRAFVAPQQLQFTRGEVTFLCTDAPDADNGTHDVLALAQRHGGRLEHEGAWTTLAFPQPQQALAVALHLQRSAARRLRCALLTLECTVASCEDNGIAHSLAVGQQHTQSQERAERVPAGTIHLCGTTWLRLGDSLDAQARCALVAAELEGDVVTSAAITLPPPPQAALSTFAGLGLT